MTDSTDKLLDEIDVKLKNLPIRTFVESSNYPVESERIFQKKERMNYDRDPISVHSKGEVSNEKYSFHKSYDDDIKKLRKMLQQQSFDTTDESHSPQEDTFNSSAMGTEVIIESNNNSLQGSANSTCTEDFRKNELYTCSCNCGAKLEQIIEERNELKARIHRGEASKASIEERQELEHALHAAKSEIFRERKRSRQIIEDLEDKLEEAQHLYETLEKNDLAPNFSKELNMKDELIQSLKEKVQSLEIRLENQKIDIDKDREINLMSQKYAQQSQELENTTKKLNEQHMQYEEMKQTVLATEQGKWERLLTESEEREKRASKKSLLSINELEKENRKLVSIIEDLTNRQNQLCKDLEEKERFTIEDLKTKVNKVNEENDNLKEKNECLKEEIANLFSKNSQFEIEMIKREKQQKKDYSNKEQEQKFEIKELHEKIEHLQLEVADALLKTKNGRVESEHREKLLVSNIFDQCQKLVILYKSMKPNIETFEVFSGNQPLSTKEAVTRLHEVVQLLSRSSNELLCEVARLKRNARRPIDYHKSSHNTFTDDEISTLRKQLQDKEDEIQSLKLNMNHWKDLTAQRLTKKFQEELHLQMERKMGISYPDPQATCQVNYSSSANDSSTVKLLCHLQSRVKQLRSENDFLKSSSIIRGINESDG